MIATIKDLQISFPTTQGEVHAVNGVDLSIPKGKVVALVGQSGSGKTALAKSLIGLHKSSTKVCANVLEVAGYDLLSLDKKTLCSIRTSQISMVLQNPLSSLNPTMKVGKQLQEVLELHLEQSSTLAKKSALDLLQLVKIPAPQEAYNKYPHELSGGMRQRIVIAMAIACHPKLVILDEPTTALDAQTEAEILNLLLSLQQKFKMAFLFITHNLLLAKKLSHYIAVMYQGKIVEMAPTSLLFSDPLHPYTQQLLQSIPTLSSPLDLPLATISRSDQLIFGDEHLYPPIYRMEKIPNDDFARS